MSFFEFISIPAVSGILTALFGSGLTAFGAYMYKIYLAKSEKETKSDQFTVDALKAQLEGWVNYSKGLTQTIAAQSSEIATLHERLSRKDQEISDLWSKIRQIERQGE